MPTATARAHPNIAFIKYWGNRDHSMRLPANGSISMNLEGLHTRTQVTFDPALETDTLAINGEPASSQALARAVALLDRVREQAGLPHRAQVESENNFPAGAGIASSASGFAALALATSAAAGLDLTEPELSRLARTGSGSAARSVPAGFTEWLPGESDMDSFGISIAPPDHWGLVDCVAVVSTEHKATGSTRGHRLADTSLLQPARVLDAPRRLDLCRRAILDCDFDALAAVSELDSNLMHAVMITSRPPLLYWLPATLGVMQAVVAWRSDGLQAFYTVDAGPNVHVIAPAGSQEGLVARLQSLPGVQSVIVARPGGAAHLLPQADQAKATPTPAP